ncbi:MAG: efflux RND transporter periplasmic adaptor subunit [Hyphomicrobiaceae bacterium]
MNEQIGHKQQAEIEAMLAENYPSRGGRRLLKPALLAITAAAVAAFGVWWFYPASESVVRYRTQTVMRGDLTVLVTATGSVQPIKKVDISSELSGTIRKVNVDFNSTVTAGQVLAELDTDKLKATLESSRARLAAAKAKVSDAEATVTEKRRDLERKRALATKNFTSTQDLDLAKAAFDRAIAGLAVATADVGVAQADLTLNETNLAKAAILSPINGVVLSRNADPGQTVASSLQAPILFSIAEDLEQMELQVNVDEADVGSVKAGQSAAFTVDAYPGRRFPATIRDVRFAPETVQGVVTYKAVLNVDNSELLLRPGMTATAEIRSVEIKDALLAPNQALRFTPGSEQPRPQENFLRQLLPLPGIPRSSGTGLRRDREQRPEERRVYVQRDGGPVAVAVKVGVSDGRNTEITGGELKSGDEIIIGIAREGRRSGGTRGESGSNGAGGDGRSGGRRSGGAAP